MLWLSSIAWSASCLDLGEVESLDVSVDFVQSALERRWVVRVDAQACEADASLPSGLTDATVTIRSADEVGIVRADVVSDGVLSGLGSGSLDPWRAVASQTKVVFRSPRSVPLQVYSDDAAHHHRAGDRQTVWWSLAAKGEPTLVWSTWSDWVAAGTALERAMKRRIPKATDLGMMGRSLNNAELATLVDRLDRQIILRESPDRAWSAARPVDEVLAEGAGTSTERGLVLLAMLKGAGFDARPAWFTPEAEQRLPRTLPAPHLLTEPAVAVRSGKDILYLDPGSVGARPPEVPARMRGARVLVAGRHLAVPLDSGAPRGTLRSIAEIEVSASGQMQVVVQLTPTGAAEQLLRARLSGLSAQRWPEVLEDWITARGDLRDPVVDVKGLDGAEPFRIDIRYVEPEKLSGSGSALRGTVRDLVAPRLAAWLPPGVAIEERITVRPPDGMVALTALRPEVKPSTSVLLNRTLSAEDRDLILGSDWRVLTDDIDEQGLLQLGVDTEILLFPNDKTARKLARRLALPEPDRRMIEAMLAWRTGFDDKAVKLLDKLHPDLSVAELAALITTYVPPGDRRPWEALVRFVGTDAERIAVIEGLIDTGDRRLAWQLATFLAQKSQDAQTRALALVQVARLQGAEAPEPAADPEGNRAWREPTKLLERAQRLAADDPVVQLDLAIAYLRNGQPMNASGLVDEAAEDDPLAMAVRAEFGAITGVAGVDVLGLASAAVDLAPFDPDVRESVGRARALLGRRRQGVGDLLLAAELSGNDASRWMVAADQAVRFGDLRAAVFAARRASDLRPTDRVPAVKLQLLAKLARDEDSASIARARSELSTYDEMGDSLDDLLELAPERELALLRHHSGEVEASRTLLRRRAALHAERGMMEDAALDGSLLLDRYRDGLGASYLLAGVTSRIRHSNPGSLIRRYTRDARVREAKMDLDLVLGKVPVAVGKRGKIVSRMRSSPERVASQSETWPMAMQDFEREAPSGFKSNRWLSGVRGVLAWSNAEQQVSILRTERSTGALPPPLSNLYTTGPTVLSTSRGATVTRLDGGAIPVFVGITLFEGQDVFGLGLSPAAARDAVLYGIDALEAPSQ